MFLRRNPLCMDPFLNHAREGLVEPSRCTDHIIPHQGDRVKFMDPLNRGAICLPCHARKTFEESKGNLVIYPVRSVSEIQLLARLRGEEK